MCKKIYSKSSTYKLSTCKLSEIQINSGTRMWVPEACSYLRVHKLNVHPLLGLARQLSLGLSASWLCSRESYCASSRLGFAIAREILCLRRERMLRPPHPRHSPPQTLRVPTGLPELWQGCQGLGRGFSTPCFQTLKLLVPEAVMGVNPLLGLQTKWTYKEAPRTEVGRGPCIYSVICLNCLMFAS